MNIKNQITVTRLCKDHEGEWSETYDLAEISNKGKSKFVVFHQEKREFLIDKSGAQNFEALRHYYGKTKDYSTPKLGNCDTCGHRLTNPSQCFNCRASPLADRLDNELGIEKPKWICTLCGHKHYTEWNESTCKGCGYD